MVNTVEKFVLEFFTNLKCAVVSEGKNFVVSGVPKSFEDVFGKSSPYVISFVEGKGDVEFAGEGSRIMNSINKYLESAGKTTILKIDFEVEPMKEINKVFMLKNCEINNIAKKHHSHFFSRFTFKTSFQFLNEVESVVNEVYVHDGKIVKGDLAGYRVLDGETKNVSGNDVQKDYEIARTELKEKLKTKTLEIGELLKKKVDNEIGRIKEHYNSRFHELGGDLNQTLDKIKELELKLKVSEDDETDSIKIKIDKLKKSLLKIGDDEAITKITKEQDFTIKDAIHKHSLNIDNKLINTTLVYYPVFSFNLFLKGENNSGRFVDMTYNPLTKEINKVLCESCGLEIKELNLCSGGHISCNKCLKKCGDCHNLFCTKCLKKVCSICGRALCKNCMRTCLSCRKYICKSHLRKDCVNGEEKCTNCLRACLRCHGLANPRYFGESIDGSKVCQKCLGEEKRKMIMKGME